MALFERLSRSAAERHMHPLALAVRYVVFHYGCSVIASLAPNFLVPPIHRLRGLRAGRGVFIDRSVYIDESFPELITIGEQTRVCAHAVLVAHVSASPRMKDLGLLPFRTAPIRIGAHAFIGVGAIVLPGVTIGDEAVVAAGSVVVHDVPPATVVAGNPAQIVRAVTPASAAHR
jgi:acetyltransferase-like isoleucine patch superfamily enzyme